MGSRHTWSSFTYFLFTFYLVLLSDRMPLLVCFTCLACPHDTLLLGAGTGLFAQDISSQIHIVLETCFDSVSRWSAFIYLLFSNFPRNSWDLVVPQFRDGWRNDEGFLDLEQCVDPVDRSHLGLYQPVPEGRCRRHRSRRKRWEIGKNLFTPWCHENGFSWNKMVFVELETDSTFCSQPERICSLLLQVGRLDNPGSYCMYL